MLLLRILVSGFPRFYFQWFIFVFMQSFKKSNNSYSTWTIYKLCTFLTHFYKNCLHSVRHFVNNHLSWCIRLELVSSCGQTHTESHTDRQTSALLPQLSSATVMKVGDFKCDCFDPANKSCVIGKAVRLTEAVVTQDQIITGHSKLTTTHTHTCI